MILARDTLRDPMIMAMQQAYITSARRSAEEQGRAVYLPHPGPQYAFLSSTADEVLYGGAAGGGKTFALMVFPLHFVDTPGFRGLLLRRTFPELERSIIVRSHDLYRPLGARYSEQRKAWRFPSGAVIEFGYLDRDQDVAKYQSAEYQYIGFDELTHFTEYQFDYMRSRLRSGMMSMPCYLRAGTNPGGVGHVWAKARFIDTCPPGEILRFARVYGDDGEQIEIRLEHDQHQHQSSFTRQFIPARVQDNLTIMHNDPNYIDRLNNMSDLQRRMLLLGDWDVYAGQMFSMWRKAVHVVPPRKPAKDDYKFVSIDYGTAAPAAILWHSVDYSGNDYVYRELYGPGMSASVQADRIREMTPPEEEIRAYIGGEDMFIKNQNDARTKTLRSIADYFSDPPNKIYLTPANNSRVHGWNVVREYLHWAGTESALTKKPKLTISEHCRNLIRTLPALTSNVLKPEDADGKCEDHAPESLRYGLMHVDSPDRKKQRGMDIGYRDHGNAKTHHDDINSYANKGTDFV